MPDADVTSTVDKQLKDIRARFSSDAEFRAELHEGRATARRRSTALPSPTDVTRNETITRTIRKLREDGKIVPGQRDGRRGAGGVRAQQGARCRSARRASRGARSSSRRSRRAAAKERARAKAESLLVELKSGGDFEQLAKRESMDPGSKDNGGDLGWNRRGKMVAEFDRWMFALPPGPAQPRGRDAVRLPHHPRGPRPARRGEGAPHPHRAEDRLGRRRARARSRPTAWRRRWKAGAPFDSLAKKHHDFSERRGDDAAHAVPARAAARRLPARRSPARRRRSIVVFQIPGNGNVPGEVRRRAGRVGGGGWRPHARRGEGALPRAARGGGRHQAADGSLRKGRTSPCARTPSTIAPRPPRRVAVIAGRRSIAARPRLAVTPRRSARHRSGDRRRRARAIRASRRWPSCVVIGPAGAGAGVDDDVGAVAPGDRPIAARRALRRARRRPRHRARAWPARCDGIVTAPLDKQRAARRRLRLSRPHRAARRAHRLRRRDDARRHARRRPGTTNPLRVVLATTHIALRDVPRARHRGGDRHRGAGHARGPARLVRHRRAAHRALRAQSARRRRRPLRRARTTSSSRPPRATRGLARPVPRRHGIRARDARRVRRGHRAVSRRRHDGDQGRRRSARR